eukprot:1743812-Prorocentrum_lima.AAC.1
MAGNATRWNMATTYVLLCMRCGNGMKMSALYVLVMLIPPPPAYPLGLPVLLTLAVVLPPSLQH